MLILVGIEFCRNFCEDLLFYKSYKNLQHYNNIVHKQLMNSLSMTSHYEKYHKMISLEVRQKLLRIRELDKKLLKMKISVSGNRNYVLKMIEHYERRKQIENPTREWRYSSILLEKKQKKDLEGQILLMNLQRKRYSCRNRCGRSSLFHVKSLKQEIYDMLKDIKQTHQQMLKLSAEKIELSNQLCRFIVQPFQEREKQQQKQCQTRSNQPQIIDFLVKIEQECQLNEDNISLPTRNYCYNSVNQQLDKSDAREGRIQQ